jgi:hypothetical protein
MCSLVPGRLPAASVRAIANYHYHHPKFSSEHHENDVGKKQQQHLLIAKTERRRLSGDYSKDYRQTTDYSSDLKI